MNKRSFALIMATAALVLCLLSPFASAVTISYTADSGGESVSIDDNYDVDNSVTVKETTDISFGNLQVDQERTAEGTGEADLKQTISGKSVDGTGYVAENVILSEGTINAKSSTSATANTLGVDQTVSAAGDAELLLEGEEGDNTAGHGAIVVNGRLNSKQTLDIGDSVRTSVDASIWGDFGYVSAMAEDADGNWAATIVWVRDGELSTVQGAEADGSATAVQESVAIGTLIWLATVAKNQYGDTLIENVVENGTLNSLSGAIANEDEAFCAQYMNATGSYIFRFVEAENDVVPDYDNNSIELWDNTREETSTATVNETSAVVTVVP
jgi:hypothetical protein